MKMYSKRYNNGIKNIDLDSLYELEEAVELLKQFPNCKFDETVELAISLRIDSKKSDQVIRGTVVLPHGTGKDLRIIAFCQDKDVSAAKEAGVVEAGAEELVKKVEQGWLEFDAAVATQEMMKDMGRLGRVLGPRGMMPNPKTGTLTDDVSGAIKELKKGKIEFKADSGGTVHVPVGKVSFTPENLLANIKVMIDAINKSRPASIKTGFVKKIVLTSTMSAGIKIKI